MSRRGNLVPVVREILADLDTPLSIFRKLDDGRTTFLFESVEGGEKWARYSFVGCGARAIFRARGHDIEWSEGGEVTRERVDGDPLEYLRERIARHVPVTLDEIELPRFFGGAVGMIGYDWVRFVEQVPDDNPDELDLPDLWFVFPETVVVYDNVRHTALLVYNVDLRESASPEASYREAGRILEETARTLRAPMPAITPADGPRPPMEVSTSVPQEAFHEIVKRAKEYIEAGDIFQVVLGVRYTVPLQVDPFALYRQLRLVNPSPYLFFVRMEGPVLIGASPEILVRLEGDQVEVRPIAGTRRRGRTPEHDLEMEHELRNDPKEISEHVMLVDLGRNDVGRIAEVGSVKVTEYASIERYSHVMHIVSHVVARLREGKDWLDVLRATFPAGTLSGAPKVRAMEIIDELETVRRGPFGGCVGYIDYTGNMDLAIAIRTMLVKDERISVQAGAGIVVDSDPALEWKECNNKARALIHAIDMARESHDE